jgi:hypothetical protein
VINRSEHDLLANIMAKLFEEIGVELLPIVNNYFLGYSESAYDILPEELFDCFRGYID